MCDGVQFVGADATIEEFLPAGFAVKEPFVTALHQRHGERPVLVAHEEEGAVPALRIHGNALLFAGLGSEIRGVLPVLREFAAEYNVVAVGTKDLSERNHVELVGRIDQRIGSLLRSVKPPGPAARDAVAGGVLSWLSIAAQQTRPTRTDTPTPPRDRVQTRPERFTFADVDFISCSCDFLR